MTISYAAAGELLLAWTGARTAHDGGAFTGLFDAAGTLAPDPWSAMLAGHNDLRAYLLTAASAERDLELAVERHWVSGDTVLAAWHAGWTSRDAGVVRLAGFLVAEVGSSGRIAKMRLWTVAHPGHAG